MECREGLILIGILFLVHPLAAYANTKEGLNAAPYYILCGVYNIVANPPDFLYNPSEVAAIRQEIDVINMSLSDETWFSQISKTVSEAEAAKDSKSKDEIEKKSLDRWREAASRLATSATIKKIFSGGTSVKVAQSRIKKVSEQADKIIASIEQAKTTANLDEVKREFQGAVGEKKIEDENEAYGLTNRGTDCGKTNGQKGTKAGSNLVVDFLCLCQEESGNNCNTGAACGKECVDAYVSSGAWANNRAPNKANEVWKKLKAGCTASRPLGVPTATAGYAAIGRFLDQIGVKQNHGSGLGIVGLLGHCEGSATCSTGCNGQVTGNAGPCVAYGVDPQVWNQDSKGIEWLRKVEKGLGILAKAETINRTLQHDISNLKILQHRAEEIYEEAKVGLELESANPEKLTLNQTSKGVPTTISDKSSAQEPNAVSTANVARFTLPWALFI